MKRPIYLFICLFIHLSSLTVEAQTVHNLNSNAQATELNVTNRTIPQEFLKEAKSSRKFTINPTLQKAMSIRIGDMVDLQLFEGETFMATVSDISTGLNGNFTITLKLNDYPMAFGYITTGKNGKSLFFVSIPELNRKFTSRSSINSQTDYLIEFMDGIDLKLINDEKKIPKIIPENTGSRLMESRASQIGSGAVNCLRDPGLSDTDPATLDVLIVYTQKALTWANANEGGISNLLNGALFQAQAVLDNQGNGDVINFVHAALTDYIEDPSTSMDVDLDRLTDTNDGFMDEVHQLRKQYNADIVVLIEENNINGGMGWVLMDGVSGDYDYAFCVVRVQQASGTTALIHEIGHNMSMMHEKQQYGTPLPNPLYPYGWGYFWTVSGTTYGSVMSYEGTETPFFSNPNAFHSGVPTGTANENNAQVFRNIKHVVAYYSEILKIAPEAPANIVISEISNDGATFSWDAVPNATEYWIIGPNYQAYWASDNTSYTINNSAISWFPSSCTTYSFTIQAVNECGHRSSYTSTFRTRCPTDPTVATSAATNITSNAATLNKTVMANGDAVTTQGFMYRESTAPTWQTSASDNLSGLTPDTEYKFYAFANTAAGTFNGKVLTFKTAIAPVGKPGDINNDGKVDAADLSMLIADFGKSGAAITNPAADINGDGKVDSADLSILIANFGK